MIATFKQLIRIAFVSSVGKDTGPIPIQQISARGRSGNSVAWHDYGFHSVPPDDTFCLVLVPSGNGEERVHIATSAVDRPNGEPGDVFIFHPKTGSSIKFDKAGNITINAVGDVAVISPGQVGVTSPDILLTGNVVVDGTLDVTAAATFDATVGVGTTLTVTGASTLGTTVTSNGVNISDDHVHNVPFSSGPGLTQGAQ